MFCGGDDGYILKALKIEVSGAFFALINGHRLYVSTERLKSNN